MSLSLLAPLLLGLGAFVALPIIAHISRQKPRERVPFGAMLLLRRVVKRLRRRRRVRDPLLLLLRVLAVLLIALAMAGPRWSYQDGTPTFGGTGRVVLLVDRSLSMSLTDGGSTLLARARSEAESVLGELPQGTLIGAVAFDDQAVALTDGLTTDPGLVRARLGALQPTLGGSNLRQALLEARRLLAGEPGEVFLFSDEAGPVMVPEAKEELRRLVDNGSAVIPRPIQGRPPRNVAVSAASYGEGIEGGTIEVRVTNYGPEAVEVPCEVSLPDGQVIPFFADLPGEGEVVERVTVPREAAGGVGEARCDDGDLPGDDARYFHLPRVGASRVLVVDGDPGDTPIRSEVYFLERALAPWGGSRSGVMPDVITPLGLLDLDPEEHQVVFLANVSDPRTVAPALSDFVRRGGAVVISAGENVSAERYNTSLGSLLPAPLRRTEDLAARGERGVPLEIPDASLELFEPFTRGGRSAFREVHSRRVVLLEPYAEGEARTLLRYTGGVPALVERSVGQGKVLLWTSSMDYDWSTLPTQAVFMPLVQRMVGYLGAEAGGGAGRLDGTVGRAVSLRLPDLTLQPEVIGPDGNPVPTRIEGTTLLFTPQEPGAYAVQVEAVPTMAWVAVNLDGVESDVRAYDSVAAAESAIKPELFTRYIDLSPWLWGLALLAFLAIGGLSLAWSVLTPTQEPA